MPGPRHHQIADRIKVVVAELLERRIKDPRLGFVTITDVRLTGDNQHASIFYTVLGDAEDVERSAVALRSATGVLRSEVGKQLGLRHTPSLEFFLDAVPDSARVIDDLLARTKERDEQLAAQAVGAEYAGDPDPYKAPAGADDGAESADDSEEIDRA